MAHRLKKGQFLGRTQLSIGDGWLYVDPIYASMPS